MSLAVSAEENPQIFAAIGWFPEYPTWLGFLGVRKLPF